MQATQSMQAMAFAINASAMLTQRGEPVPFSEFEAAMGGKAQVAIRETAVAAEHALLMKCDDPAMQPTIHRGDLLLVDTSDTRPRESRVVLVEFGGFTTARRVQIIPGGYKLLGDHTAYDPITVMHDDPDITVLGRVVTAFKEQRML